MQKDMESHGISKAEMKTNPVNRKVLGDIYTVLLFR